MMCRKTRAGAVSVVRLHCSALSCWKFITHSFSISLVHTRCLHAFGATFLATSLLCVRSFGDMSLDICGSFLLRTSTQRHGFCGHPILRGIEYCLIPCTKQNLSHFLSNRYSKRALSSQHLHLVLAPTPSFHSFFMLQNSLCTVVLDRDVPSVSLLQPPFNPPRPHQPFPDLPV